MGFRTGASIVGAFGLICTDIMTGYVMRVLSTYLTDAWGLNFTHSAAIVNMWEGLAKMLPLAIALISSLFPNPLLVPILCTISYAIGWILMTLSTPPLLARSTGTCSDYQPDCIGHTQKVLFYIGFPMVTVGMSSIVVLVAFIFGDDKEDDDESREMIGGDIASHPLLGFPNYIINIALSYIKPWSARFAIPSFFSVISVSLFLLVPYKEKGEMLSDGIDGLAKESPLTRAMRVLVASVSKLRHKLDDQTRLHEQGNRRTSLPRTRGLRFLDKAAIIVAGKSPEEQEKHKWTLCTITDVEKTKLAIRMAPLIPSIILCGVIISIGNTYFIEQANNLNPKIGKWKTSTSYLLAAYDSTKQSMVAFTFLFQLASPRSGICTAMFLSVLCCITAAKVERRRLHVIARHGLIDKPDQRIPMSMYWMLPQFILLAMVDSLLEANVKSFIIRRYKKASRLLYPLLFARAITGAGILGGILSVHLAGKFSKRVGRKVNWFQETLNRSRMDHYYWALAVLCAANFVLFLALSFYFKCRSGREYKIEGTSHKKESENQSRDIGGEDEEKPETMETVAEAAAEFIEVVAEAEADGDDD
ncbi:protein NRT1/ PTR FAMILY 5.5-like [Andrographis paniculata]|uniref:protein NRT1/ PTR FAMILY 5.5-like n=1 Tax=Andrographis paniculata TaxID=175694 RepID=UPI0021E8EDF6|nr:protein NRT1/ PTR FAMILY 5.5-like [Andrographis paniculata]